MEEQRKTKRPIYKRVWFWLLLSPFILAIILILVAFTIGIIQGFGKVINGRDDIVTQDTIQAAMSTAKNTPQPTNTPTTAPTKTPIPTPTPIILQTPVPTSTATATPTKTSVKTPTPTFPPSPTPTITPTKTPTPTPMLTPKPTIKPTPTTRPTPTPSPTIDPAEAPYGVDINGNPGPDFITLIVDFENALETMIGQAVEISTLEEDWYIRKGNFSYNLTTDCWIAKYKHEVILKIEYDKTYEHFKVFQLKVDGVNIDLD